MFIDIDECQLELYNCNSDTKCVNVPGSFHCDCHPGFVKDGKSNNLSNKREIIEISVSHESTFIRGSGWGATNVSCQLKFWPFVSCQLNFGPFVSCQ